MNNDERNQKILNAIEKYTNLAAESKQTAIEHIVSLGLYDDSGLYDHTSKEFYKQLLKELLRKNILTVTFTKLDGTEREMICTLDPQFFETSERSQPDTPKKKTNDDIITVFELNKGFRSFDINRLISYGIYYC